LKFKRNKPKQLTLHFQKSIEQTVNTKKTINSAKKYYQKKKTISLFITQFCGNAEKKEKKKYSINNKTKQKTQK